MGFRDLWEATSQLLVVDRGRWEGTGLVFRGTPRQILSGTSLTTS